MKKLTEYKNKKLFAYIGGFLYSSFGLLQIIVGFGYNAKWTQLLFIPPDYIGGFILVLIGAIFFYGLKELNDGLREGVAYIYVGIFLSLGFLVLYLLVTGADMLSAYGLNDQNFIGWTPIDNLKPGLYLAILPLIGFLIWRHKFTLKAITTAGT